MAAELQIWPIERLKPYEGNAREITADAVEKMVAVIEAQGFLDPIQVLEDGEIIAGHRRYLAAQKLGLKRVPVLVQLGLSKDEAAAYRISHNRLAQDVKYNRALLADELLRLDNLGIASPEGIGFEPKELVKLFDLDDGPPLPDGATEEKEIGPFLKRGETWEIGPVTFKVYDNLNTDGLRKAEALIPKLEKLTKAKAFLGGDPTQDFKTVLVARAAEQGVTL
jgi:hypothetical protein